MGASETEKALSKDVWKSANDVSKITGINAGNVRKHLIQLVHDYSTVKTKKILINHNYRKVYKLK